MEAGTITMTDAMSGLLPLVLIPGSALVLYFLMKNRKGANSPGSKRNPANTNPIVRQISETLFDELALPSQEFRREMGVCYPELAMAFRQSLNFGIIRYTSEVWNQQPSEALMPEMINRLLCNYFGIILPKGYVLDDVKAAITTYFKQKKMLNKVEVTGTDVDTTLRILEKDQVVYSAGPLPASMPEREQWVLDLLKVVSGNNADAKIILFRETDKEYGFIIGMSPEHCQRLLPYEQYLQPAI
ncbi:MAG: hypothetical protein K0Q50_107 [Vampirovibrio sp.]|jgi:hypothetical protein|nr:hypothetical protein [Vampirovibrio sp.]